MNLFQIFNKIKKGNPQKEVVKAVISKDEQKANSFYDIKVIQNVLDAPANQGEEEYEIVEIEILPEKMICPDCGGITLVGLEFCDKCGGELTNLDG